MKKQEVKLSDKQFQPTAGDRKATTAPEGLDNIKARLQEYRRKHEDGYRRKELIMNILTRCGITADLTCHMMLVELISECAGNPFRSLKNIMEAVITSMPGGEEINVKRKSESMERDIRSGIEKAWNKHEANNIFYLNELFGVRLFNEQERPTGKLLIFTIATRLYMLEQ